MKLIFLTLGWSLVESRKDGRRFILAQKKGFSGTLMLDARNREGMQRDLISAEWDRLWSQRKG